MSPWERITGWPDGWEDDFALTPEEEKALAAASMLSPIDQGGGTGPQPIDVREAEHTADEPDTASAAARPAQAPDTAAASDAAGESREARRHATGEPDEDAKPAYDVSEEAAGDNKPPTGGSITGRLAETTEAEEAAGDAQTSAQRFGPPGDEVKPEPEGDAQPQDTAGDDKRPATYFTVGGKPLHIYLDPARADMKASVGANVESVPVGDRIVDDENDNRSRGKRLRAKLYEHAEEISDVTAEEFTTLHKLLTYRPPTGYPEITVDPSHPVIGQEHPYGIDVGNIATAFLIAAALVGEATRLALRSRRHRKGVDDAGTR